jgi:hypothetical protein
MIFAERWLEVSLPSQIEVSRITNPADMNGIYYWNETNHQYQTSRSGQNYALIYESGTSAWWLGDPVGDQDMFIGDDGDANNLPTSFTAQDGYTGTATVTEYTGDTMAQFNVYSLSIGSDKCFRIVDPVNEKVWDKTANDNAGGFVAYGSITYANGNIELAYVAGCPGYPFTMPTAIPQGEYDILIFDAAYAAATASDYEKGYGCKWTGKAFLVPPKEKLVDRVA